MTGWLGGPFLQLRRIADALEDLVMLQIAAQGGRTKVGNLHALKNLGRPSEDAEVLYTEDLEEASREEKQEKQGWLKGLRRDGPKKV